MKYQLHKKKSHLKLYVGILILVVGAGAVTYAKQGPQQAPKPAAQQNRPKQPATAHRDVTGKYLFSGTIMLGRAVERDAAGNKEQPFSGIAGLGEYDARIGVLECPITTNQDTFQNQVDNLIFNCQPSWLPVLKKYYPILSLSSNHLGDQGPHGYAATVKNLTDAGFQTVGNYNPHAQKDNCKAVLLPVKPSGQLPVAFCSFNYKTLFKPEPGELETISKWAKKMPVIGMMNGGPEYQHVAGAAQTEVARKMIDLGADMVVGNGTHWVQNTEVYKGKLIEYSMGNFIFDQYDYDGRLALNLVVNMTVPGSANLDKWLAAAPDCQARALGVEAVANSAADATTQIYASTSTASPTCLAAAKDLAKLQPKFTFDIVGSYGGLRDVAHRANAQQQADIESRATWAATKAALGQ